MFARYTLRLLVQALAFSLTFACAWHLRAQEAQSTVDNGAASASKLFEQGQDAHARGQFQAALELYEQALKLNREFPEAEYQRAAALVSLKRFQEAEQALRRAVALRGDWVLPHVALGEVLIRTSRDREAAPVLQRALELDPNNLGAIVLLAQVHGRAGDAKASLELWRRATGKEGATAAMWAARGSLERAAGETAAAAASLDRALSIDPGNVPARLERAALALAANDFKKAIGDIEAAEQRAAQLALRSGARDVPLFLQIASLYAAAGNKQAALRTLDSLDEAAKSSTEVIVLRSDLSGEVDERTIAALEKLSQSNPQDARLLARLAAIYRTTNPERAQQLYRRAAELEPRNVDHPVGYAAALIQARRFAEAAGLLQRIIKLAPDNYPAHANLATALDELKQYREAIIEYEWISARRPELAITKFFLGRAYDLSGQYPQALAAYEEFLRRADPDKNRLEIEKVNLRLPTLRNQAKRAGAPKGGK